MHNNAMIAIAQNLVRQFDPTAANYRLRIDGIVINGAVFRLVGLSNEAVAAGMTSQENIINVIIFGNRNTDPAIALQMDAEKNWELSTDAGVTYQPVEVFETIRNDGFKWQVRVKLS